MLWTTRVTCVRRTVSLTGSRWRTRRSTGQPQPMCGSGGRNGSSSHRTLSRKADRRRADSSQEAVEAELENREELYRRRVLLISSIYIYIHRKWVLIKFSTCSVLQQHGVWSKQRKTRWGLAGQSDHIRSLQITSFFMSIVWVTVKNAWIFKKCRESGWISCWNVEQFNIYCVQVTDYECWSDLKLRCSHCEERCTTGRKVELCLISHWTSDWISDTQVRSDSDYKHSGAESL